MAGDLKMSVELLESIKQQLVELTEQERSELTQYLSEWVKKQKPEQAAQESAHKAPAPNAEEIRLKRRQQEEWLKAHRKEYGGLYVALDGDRLLGTGKNYPEAVEAAKRAGIKNAYVDFVPPPDYVGYWGGW
jgi:hypothetical protein